MKRFLLLFALVCSPLIAQAQWFQVDAQYQVNQTRATASVYNRWGAPIYCQGRVDGQTYYGQVLYAYMNTWVAPGQTRYVYVYTNGGDPFVRAWAQANCRF